MTLLREHRRHQAKHRMLLGSGYHDEDLVFCHADGSRLSPDAVTKRFQDLAKRAGLPRMRLHDLRHSWDRHAHHLGVPIDTFSRRLGHHSTAFSMSAYVHGLDGADAAAAELVNRQRGAS